MDLRSAIGFGVAGNFAGHLEQAGEASDFTAVKAAENWPKGVFPFYVPRGGPHSAEEAGGSFLHVFPLSRDRIEHPGALGGAPAKLQIEPELALRCRLTYAEAAADGRRPVADVEPTHFTAYNDCSTRRPDATKISQKKNWGPSTKGLADDQWIALDRFEAGGVLDRFRLACFLRRDGELHAYGEDAPVAGPDGYAAMYRPLLDWLVDRLNHQTDHGPLEDLAAWLNVAGHPTEAVIAIGATRYTDFGETTFLQPGDESIVLVYDATVHGLGEIETLADRGGDVAGQSFARLSQAVVAR